MVTGEGNRPMSRPVAIKFLDYLLLHVSRHNRQTRSEEGAEDLYLQNESDTVYKKVRQKVSRTPHAGFRWARVRFSLFLSLSIVSQKR